MPNTVLTIRFICQVDWMLFINPVLLVLSLWCFYTLANVITNKFQLLPTLECRTIKDRVTVVEVVLESIPMRINQTHTVSWSLVNLLAH